MTHLTLAEILEKTSSEVISNDKSDKNFSGVAPLNLAQKEHISFLANEKYFDEALQSKAGLILCTKKEGELLLNKVPGCLVVSENPYAAFAKVSQFFFKPQHPFSGISEQAIVDKSATIHPTATIFPFVFVGPGASIGAHTVVYSGCFIGAASTVGEDCIFYPNVVVREGCHIKDRCILNPGVVIGGDGFGFAPTEKENVKIPQIGGVQIESDVEIGANATVDRGAMADTKIGRQTKIDNLVMIAHNVVVGEFCFFAAQVGIAGSSTVGNHVMLGGQVGISGHVKIADKVSLMAQSGVAKSILTPGAWGGTPSRPQKEYAVSLAVIHKLTKQAMQKH